MKCKFLSLLFPLDQPPLSPPQPPTHQWNTVFSLLSILPVIRRTFYTYYLKLFSYLLVFSAKWNKGSNGPQQTRRHLCLKPRKVRGGIQERSRKEEPQAVCKLRPDLWPIPEPRMHEAGWRGQIRTEELNWDLNCGPRDSLQSDPIKLIAC